MSLQLTMTPSQYALTWLASPAGEGVQGLVKTASISKHPSFKNYSDAEAHTHPGPP